MCTVSWLYDGDGYQLLCNRDERRSRSRATGPRVHQRNGVRYVAPLDGNFGGTWILTNELGVSLCLLNGANVGGGDIYPRFDSRRSRGLLLVDLVSSRSALEAC